VSPADAPKIRCQECKEKLDKYQKVQHRRRNKVCIEKVKDIVFVHYGKFCACCKCTESVFLTLDHVNNDGAKHRKEIGTGNQALYRWVIKNNFPDSIQVLCFNCNCGKAKNKGICPHKVGGDEAAKISLTI